MGQDVQPSNRFCTVPYLEWMLVEANGVENTASRPNIHTVCHREVGPRICGYNTQKLHILEMVSCE
jgi:hypothetical protein